MLVLQGMEKGLELTRGKPPILLIRSLEVGYSNLFRAVPV